MTLAGGFSGPDISDYNNNGAAYVFGAGGRKGEWMSTRDANETIAYMFDTIADVLELQGDIPYRIRAYRNAARTVRDLPEPIEEYAQAETLETLAGIGKELAAKIVEYLTTGRMSKYEEVTSQVPPGLLELLHIPGLGPKRVRLLQEQLGISNLEDLRQALDTGKIETLPGMGKKTVENIRRGLVMYEASKERMPLGRALPIAEEIARQIDALPGTARVIIAGSARRMKETVGDIDILTIAENGEATIRAFVHFPQVKDILAAGDTKGSVVLHNGLQVDLRVVPPESYGAALHYFTGSRAHNIKIRTLARERGLKVNEYGIFRGEERIAGEEENDVFEVLGMTWIPPEMREDRGEIEAAMAGTLPVPVRLEDIRGDLQMHSKWSDGANTLRDLAHAARVLGYEYIAVTDHSPRVRVAGGMSIEKVWQRQKEIEALNREFDDFRVLSGAEVDILPDGSLDYPDEVLAALDIVLVSVHSGFKMSKEEMTERILRALENPYVHILAHPTGRIIGQREAYPLDLEAVLKRAAELGVAVEINGYYLRLDLNDVHAHLAKTLGCTVSLGTDAHQADHLRMMRYAVGVARRAWLEPKEVLNTRPLQDLLTWLRRRRDGLQGAMPGA